MITLCREGEEPPFFAMIRVVLLSVSVTKPSVRVCTEYPSQGCATCEKLFMLPARLGWAGVGGGGGGGTSHTLHPTVRDSASRAARPGPHPAPASHYTPALGNVVYWPGHWPPLTVQYSTGHNWHILSISHTMSPPHSDKNVFKFLVSCRYVVIELFVRDRDVENPMKY